MAHDPFPLSGCWPLAVSAPAVAGRAGRRPGVELQRRLNHLREGRLRLAVEEFRKAVRAGRQEPVLPQGAGPGLPRHRQVRRRHQSSFRKALELNPYYVDVRNDLGTALILSGRRDEGKNEFLTAFNEPTNPTPEISSRNLGQAYLEEKNYAEADQLVPHQPQPQPAAIPTPTSASPTRSGGRAARRGAGHAGGGSEGMPAERGHPPRSGRGLFARRPLRGGADASRRGAHAAIRWARPAGGRPSSSSSSPK